ncbi:GAF domain-containing protein [Poseidonocella sp. HB161398]|uniref:GAF domain-containing protein n=1 Tax=Poseidonocella sp. HB161398 TaxID=2320855 RepID=UPI001109EF2A|nr:GAF domain-containing protein [Poseidonocella sp. HB161398]
MSAAIDLERLRPSMEGVVAAVLATCDAEGQVNVSLISQVHYVGPGLIALSYQFFNKTRRNLLETRRAAVTVIDCATAERYRLSLDYLETDTEGPVFEAMRARLAGIASHTGMAGVFRLQGADLCRVSAMEQVPGPALPSPPAGPSRLAAARRVAERLRGAADPGALADAALAGIAEELGITHAIFLAADAGERRLFTLASLGHAETGIGSEIAYGEGLAGAAAQSFAPVRITMMTAEYRYGAAVAGTARSLGLDWDRARTIPFPGLAMPGSQMAVPLRFGDRLCGVLLVESPEILRFSHEDEDALALIGDQIGALMVALDADRAGEEPGEPAAKDGPACIAIRHFDRDDSVFIGHDYLIKGVAGAIFWRLLQEHAASGRTEFTTRELRLDPALRLPGNAENFDTRLILLMRRLEERAAPVRLLRAGRGRLRLALSAHPVLSEADAGSSARAVPDPA